MSKMVLSLLPTQYDSLDELYRRRNALVVGEMIDGIPVDKGDPMTQSVINALNTAIENRRNNPKKFAFKRARVERDNCGKTEKDKKKENYKSPEDRKKAKSVESQQIRSAMQSGKKK